MGDTFTVEAQCADCHGTGLYVGLGERNGLAVVCHSCKGTGKITRTFTTFIGRIPREDVTHVMKTNPGIVMTPELANAPTYDEWVFDPSCVDRPGREPRDHYCPAWWYQSANYRKKPNWEECRAGGSFPQCKHFSHKSLCWKRWDYEFGEDHD